MADHPAIVHWARIEAKDPWQYDHHDEPMGFNVIATVEALEARLAHISTPLSLSIIGCVVNGPGEALMTDLGFTGGGAGSGMIYMAGKPDHKQSNDGMIDHIVELVEARAAEIRAAEVPQAAE